MDAGGDFCGPSARLQRKSTPHGAGGEDYTVRATTVLWCSLQAALRYTSVLTNGIFQHSLCQHRAVPLALGKAAQGV